MDWLASLLSIFLTLSGGWSIGDMAKELVAATTTATVVEVIDGDTIDVLVGGERERVRYIGIDTPEFDYEAGVAKCYAAEAKATNVGLVSGKEVQLVKDVSERDDYGRLLRYVYVEDVAVGESLVRAGMARTLRIEPDVSRHHVLKDAEKKARAEGAGRWGACY